MDRVRSMISLELGLRLVRVRRLEKLEFTVDQTKFYSGGCSSGSQG